MLVSILTCTLNSEKTIKDCCSSISQQTYNNIEHIVIDKSSNDKTRSICKQSKIENQKVIEQKNTGIYSALNEGIIESTGDIIGILHSDDELYDRGVINKIVKKFENEEINILFSNLIYINKNNPSSILRTWKSNIKEGIQSKDLILKKINNGWMAPHPTIFVKKDLLNEIQVNYDEKFRISSDYDFIIRLFKNKKSKIFFLNEFTIKMKSGGASNKNIRNIIIKMFEDFEILKKNKINPIKAIVFKNLSKITQFF